MLQVSNVISLMASPYPKHGLVEIVNQTAQVIDKDGAPVPLSDVRTLPFHQALTRLRSQGCVFDLFVMGVTFLHRSWGGWLDVLGLYMVPGKSQLLDSQSGVGCNISTMFSQIFWQ